MAGEKTRDPVPEIKRKLTPLFQEEELQIVLLFGSTVLGRFHKQSDVDLAFLFDRPTDIVLLTNKVIRLLGTDRVDVVDLRRCSPLLTFSAVSQGALLYERSSGLFASVYSLAFRRYLDTKKIREAQDRVVKQFLLERGLS
jgi:predicted nucleotidyltransferase